jgi:hypothetical protein
MKLNCKLLLSTLFALFIVFTNLNLQAQHRVKHPAAKKKVVQHKKAKAVAHHNRSLSPSVKFLRRTNKVIVIANNQVKKNKVYNGYLAKAVHHQRYAKKLINKKQAHRAMQHSKLARNFAFRSIQSNKGTIDKELIYNEEENKALGKNISDVELEKELKNNEPNISFIDENISDKDMTDLEVLSTSPSDYKNQ